MSGRIVWAINVILILTIIAICVWAFPYAASAFYMSRGRKALEAAQESPDGLELNTQAFDDLQLAVRWDGNNDEASALLSHVYRSLAQAYVEEGRFVEARPTFETLLEQDPEDQFALYYLARAYEEEGETEQAAEIYQTLCYFELEEDGKPPSYLGDLVAKLDQYGLWEREQVVNVVSYLVWQGAREQAEELLDYLEEKYPDEPDWPFYRGEMFHRQGDLEHAEMAYWGALTADAEYAQAYLRLGMIAEEGGRQEEGEEKRWYLGGAVKWYGQYHEIVPDDLLGLKRLAEVCAVLEDPSTGLRTGAEVEGESCREIAMLREVLEAKTDDQRIVAELLDIPVGDVELGPNLVENGEFENWGTGSPQGWEISDMATGDPWNRGAFGGGQDALSAYEGASSVRIDGFWLEQRDDREPGRYGFSLKVPVVLLPGQWYIFSVDYKTERLLDNKATIWATDKVPQEVFPNEIGLSASGEKWNHYAILRYMNVEEPQEIPAWFISRIWQSGRAWFDNVSIKTVVSAGNSDG